MHWAPPETIAVGQLELRRWRGEDRDALDDAIAASLEHLRPWLPWANAYDARHSLRERRRLWDTGEGFDYGIRDARGAVLGGVGAQARIADGGLELGYWVHRDHTRQRIATRAAAALSEAALALPGVTHVEIHHDETNHASAGVPARLGFRLLGTFDREPQAPAETGHEVHWRMERADFAASAAARLLAQARCADRG
jgi:RimJ/RimL family protein N-acetyltransferase